MQLHSKLLLWMLGLFSLLFSSGVMAPAAMADVYVIANPDMNVKESDIKEIFSGERQSIDGQKVDVSDNRSNKEEFVQKVMSEPKSKYDATWAKKAFREGIAVPHELSNDADIISHVKETPGAISYVGNAPTGVKVIKKY